MSQPLPVPSDTEAKNARRPVTDTHPPTEEQLRRLIKKKGTAPGHYGAEQITKRAAAAADAVIALARLEFGDVAGHDFHGNQYKDGADGRLNGRDARTMSDAEKMKAYAIMHGTKAAMAKAAADTGKRISDQLKALQTHTVTRTTSPSRSIKGGRTRETWTVTNHATGKVTTHDTKSEAHAKVRADRSVAANR